MKTMVPALIILALPELTSCQKDKTKPKDGCYSVISYSAEIRPIIESSCKTGLGGGTGCHDSWIDEYDNISGYMTSGSWQNEVLVTKRMPLIPNGFSIDSLTADEIKTMKCWINQGYPEN